MKIFSAVTLFAMMCLSAVSDGQTAEECSKSALPDATVEQLDMYDKDLYLEPDCVNGATPLPVHCNYMGLGLECRGCYMTCDGAMHYMEDFASEVDTWGTDAIIHFCPDAGVDDLDEC